MLEGFGTFLTHPQQRGNSNIITADYVNDRVATSCGGGGPSQRADDSCASARLRSHANAALWATRNDAARELSASRLLAVRTAWEKNEF